MCNRGDFIKNIIKMYFKRITKNLNTRKDSKMIESRKFHKASMYDTYLRKRLKAKRYIKRNYILKTKSDRIYLQMVKSITISTHQVHQQRDWSTKWKVHHT